MKELVLLLQILFWTVQAQNSVCSQGFYSSFLPLSAYAPAASYCSSYYARTVTSTVNAANRRDLLFKTFESPSATTTAQASTFTTVYGREKRQWGPWPSSSSTTTTTTTTTTSTTTTTTTTTTAAATSATVAGTLISTQSTVNNPTWGAWPSSSFSSTTTTLSTITSGTTTTLSTQNANALAALLNQFFAYEQSIVSTFCSCINPPVTVTTTQSGTQYTTSTSMTATFNAMLTSSTSTSSSASMTSSMYTSSSTVQNSAILASTTTVTTSSTSTQSLILTTSTSTGTSTMSSTTSSRTSSTTTSSSTSSTTTSAISGTTTTTSTTISVACPTALATDPPFLDQYDYTVFFSSTGLRTNITTASGNDNATHPPETTYFAGSTADCDAIQQCANAALADPTIYDSFDLHYQISTSQWVCIQYYDPCVARDFGTLDTNVGKVYGYNIVPPQMTTTTSATAPAAT